MEPILYRLMPKGETFEVKPHDGEEFGFVLSGRVILVDGDKEITVRKGETFYIKGLNTHYLKNESSVPAKVLWITTPPMF